MYKPLRHHLHSDLVKILVVVSYCCQNRLDPDLRSKLVRYVVVVALGALGDTRAAPAIIGVLTDKDRDVRERAAKALAVLTGEGPDQTVAMGPVELEKWWKTWWKKHRKVSTTQPGR